MRKQIIHKRGWELLNDPLLNKGSAFTLEERQHFGLEGILPSHVNTIEDQCQRSYANIARKLDPLEKHIGLVALQNRNEQLFYRLILEHLEEFLPIIYTPTVGEACQNFSKIFRKTRGLWITPEHKGRIDQVFRSTIAEQCQKIRLVVVTDNERILGLGDQGAGGMGIPVGKLSLYTVAAGIHPHTTLPISLDVGTDNQELLTDPLYLGYRSTRLRSQAYDELVEEFVCAVKMCFPYALLQWEDFKKQNAFDLLDRYQKRLPSFNDDIQGTAAVALAGVIAACRSNKQPLADQRILILGAGAAGIGIARQLKDALMRVQEMSTEALRRKIAITDSKGLLKQGKTSDAYKSEFAWQTSDFQYYNLENNGDDLLAIVESLKPTVLIGTTGQPGAFSEELIRMIAKHCERPLLCPFSNPTSKSEALPSDLLQWTAGKALVATGSPFEPVNFNGKTHVIGQGNNAYVFPGVGLGALAAKAQLVTDGMFSVAAKTLAANVSDDELNSGQLYPSLKRLRQISRLIAIDVAREANPDLTRSIAEERVDELIWYPEYASYV